MRNWQEIKEKVSQGPNHKDPYLYCTALDFKVEKKESIMGFRKGNMT